MISDSFIEHIASQYNSPAFIDEVGMGAIFGELIACAVLITAPFENALVNDSKRLKHETIYRLAPELRNRVIYSYGIVSAKEVCKIRNLVSADKLAMQRAVNGLPVRPDALFIDGIHPIEYPCPVYTIIKGDEKVFGIAVASIIAKDYRDRFIVEHYGNKYARYSIASNKGYRSPDHLMALRIYGVTDLHRFYMPQIKQVINGGYDRIFQKKYSDRWLALRKKVLITC